MKQEHANMSGDAGDRRPVSTAPLVRLDWLQGTVESRRVPEVRAFLEELTGVEPTVGRGLWRYRRTDEFRKGVQLLWSPNEEGRQEVDHATVVLRGSGLSSLTTMGVRDTFDWLVGGMGAKVGRLDVAFDDSSRRIDPTELYERYVKGGFYKGLRSHRYIESNGERGGATVEFGRAGKTGSGHVLVVYDKTAESLGAIDAIRWESRFYDKHARQAVEWLQCEGSGSDEAWGNAVAACVARGFAFYDPNGSTNRVHRLKAAWWMEMGASLGRATFPGTDWWE